MSTERTVLTDIIKRAIRSGYVVSVNDGEEWAVKLSSNLVVIRDAAMSVDDCMLRIRDAGDNRHIGDMHLVFGNEPDGSELVSDCTDSIKIHALI